MTKRAVTTHGVEQEVKETGRSTRRNGSGLAGGGRTHGGAGGPRSGDGGDGAGPAEAAITEGDLPQRLAAGP